MAITTRSECRQKDPVQRTACLNERASLREAARLAEAAKKEQNRLANELRKKQKADDKKLKQALKNEQREREKKAKREHQLAKTDIQAGGSRTSRDLLDTLSTVANDVLRIGQTQMSDNKKVVAPVEASKSGPDFGVIIAVLVVIGGAVYFIIKRNKKS